MNKTTFVWPAPPYFDIATDLDESTSDSCLLYMQNGTKTIGKILQFTPEDSGILFKSMRSESSQIIPLKEVKTVRLKDAQAFTKQTSPLEARAKQLYPASEQQAFNIVFIDKEVLRGETLGYTKTSNGVFLFILDPAGKVISCFTPYQAMASYQIGSKIGELLVSEEKVSHEEVNAALSQQQQLRIQRIGDFLYENKVISSTQLEKAIELQNSQPILKLGEALQQLKLITPEQLEAALIQQKQNRNLPLGQILIQMKIVDNSTLKGVLAKKLGIPYVVLKDFDFDADAIKLVEKALVYKYKVMPLCLHNQDMLIVAMENPLDYKALDQIRFVTQKNVVPALASLEEIESAIKNHYSESSAIPYFNDGAASKRDIEYNLHESIETLNTEALTEKLVDEGIEFEGHNEVVEVSDNTLVRLINRMIMDAYEGGASDIHIETYAGKQNTRVRFRKDGTLVPYIEVPASARNSMISRIKIMAQLDIADRRKPQDGKINFQNFGPAKIELRVATLPTNSNLEDVVMRILASSKPLPMEKLGLDANIFADLQKIMLRPNGLILVCGPTGSGKTTTLHSMLGYINTPDRKIWTAEDPVEITQDGLRQVQVNAKIGWTFAAAMRSFLRADPDVIMVGEMRDEETTKTAIEASLTGHLVLSTLHTNSAPESIVRLLDLGMDPFNFADALQAVLAQRLAKALCVDCKQAYDAGPAEIQELLNEYVVDTKLNADEIFEDWKSQHMQDGKFKLYRASSCGHCNKTGYRGRIGLHELMLVNPEIKHLIQIRATVSELRDASLAAGMQTLKQRGIIKVLQGLTDIAQIRSVAA